MADISALLPIRTLNDGINQPADVTVGLLDASNARIAPAKEDGNLASVKTNTDNLDVVLSTRASESTLASVDATLDVDLSTRASEATLAAIKDTDGIKKITDALPVGDNALGKVKLLDAGGSNVGAVDVNGSLSTRVKSATNVDLNIDANGSVRSNLRDATGAEVLGQKAMAASLPVAIASDQSPVNVNVVSEIEDDPVTDFDEATSVAASATATHTFESAGDPFVLEKVFASASGKLRVEVKVGPTGSEVTKWVGFNSSANPNIEIDCSGFKVPDGDRVLVVKRNMENAQAQTLYSTIMGFNG